MGWSLRFILGRGDRTGHEPTFGPQERQNNSATDPERDSGDRIDQGKFPTEGRGHQRDCDFIHQRRRDEKCECDSDRKTRLHKTEKDRHRRAGAEWGQCAKGGGGGVAQQTTAASFKSNPYALQRQRPSPQSHDERHPGDEHHDL